MTPDGLGLTKGFSTKVVVTIVSFRNAPDIVDCLRALADAGPEPAFEVFIAENGGPEAMDTLIHALATDNGPCRSAFETVVQSDPSMTARSCLFRLVRAKGTPDTFVHAAEMTENLGYAAAINAWLRPLLRQPGWDAAWILNPDTVPTPSALSELVSYSECKSRGMVGSCIIPTAYPDRVHMRGIAWRRVVAKTLAIDHHTPIAVMPNSDDVEARMHAPSGASCYVTRELIERIGLMDERYFLFFEDLEWGCRAKSIGEIGYAHRSIVPHKCATTIGLSNTRAASPLAVYLEIRNAIIFVRSRYPFWLPWTILMQIVHISRFGLIGSFSNMMVGYHGLLAGLRGERGRPDQMVRKHGHSLEILDDSSQR
jgi:GT2 family glycosyltransferase